jgi:nitrite reductase (NO-forming)
MNLIKTVYKMKKFVFTIAMIAVAIHGFSQNTDKGKKIKSQVWIAFHQPTGLGIPGAFSAFSQIRLSQ